jgi:hypothetical protein
MAGSKKTKIVISKYNGHSIFAIWTVDPCGNNVGKTPLISFGLDKAKEIWDVRGDLKKFLSENGIKVDE